MTKIKPGDKVRVLDPDRPGAKFSKRDYPRVWCPSMDSLIGETLQVGDYCAPSGGDWYEIDGWAIHESDLELIEQKQNNNMKKNDINISI